MAHFQRNHSGFKRKGNKLPLTEKDYKKIRRMIRGGMEKMKHRDLLLLSLQTNTSLRAGDVLKLNVGQVFRNQRVISKFWLEQTKTGDQAAITILDCIKEDIQHAKDSYEQLFQTSYFSNPDFPLFPSWKQDRNNQFQPLTYSRYLALLKQWVADIGLNPDQYGTHSLRSTIPVDYYRKTRDVVGASKLFGHKSTKTTAGYLDEVAKDMALEYRKTYFFGD